MMSLMQIRIATPDDYPELASWALAHGVALDTRVLPPHRCYIATLDDVPVLTVSLHLALDVGIATLDHLISRPGLGFGTFKRALALLVDFCSAICAANDYGRLDIYVNARLAKVAAQYGGFQPETEPLIHLTKRCLG